MCFAYSVGVQYHHWYPAKTWFWQIPVDVLDFRYCVLFIFVRNVCRSHPLKFALNMFVWCPNIVLVFGSVVMWWISARYWPSMATWFVARRWCFCIRAFSGRSGFWIKGLCVNTCICLYKLFARKAWLTVCRAHSCSQAILFLLTAQSSKFMAGDYIYYFCYFGFVLRIQPPESDTPSSATSWDVKLGCPPVSVCQKSHGILLDDAKVCHHGLGLSIPMITGESQNGSKGRWMQGNRLFPSNTILTTGVDLVE